VSKDISTTLETASQEQEISTRTLVTIYLDEATQRFIANDNQDLQYNGNTYLAASIEIGDVESTTDAKVEQVELTLTNKWLEWASYFATVGNKMNGKRCTIEEVFLDYPDEESIWVFNGKLSGPHMTVSELKVNVVRSMINFEAEGPLMDYDPNCQYRKFKDERCQYAGTETICDMTPTRCFELGNILNFGGHPSVAREMVTK